MPNVISIKKRRRKAISRGTCGDGIIRIDPEAADILEGFLEKTGGQVSVKELASSLIRYAANDTIIKIEDEEE